MEEREVKVSNDVKKLVEERERLRKEKKWKEADVIRDKIKEKGYSIQDTDKGIRVEKT